MRGRESSEMKKKNPETKNPNPMQRSFKWIKFKVRCNGREEMGNTMVERKYRGKRKKKRGVFFGQAQRREITSFFWFLPSSLPRVKG